MAPFEVVADKIRRQITDEVLKKGEKLPSHRDLASTYDVAVMTAQKAVRLLVKEGWATPRGSVGTFVSSTWDQGGRPVSVEQLAQEVARLRDRLDSLEAQVNGRN